MNKALSGNEIKNILEKYNKKTHFYTYNDLLKISDINQLFKEYKDCILFYESEGIGHWTALLKHPSSIEVFDSYGMLPDDQLKYLTVRYDKELCKLLSNEKKVEYNDYQFQKLDEKIKTCGRWCICRLLFRFLNIDEFISAFKEINDFGISKVLI